ncbi:hypothetical protein G9A89_002742 [Geosiphon pyriformis]|nr:hypothetical protein G9A89_002742 [Geosiphon pyriformis]
MAFVLCFLNADSILGHLFNHRSLDLQVLDWSPIYFLRCPIRLRVSPVNNFLAEVIRIFLNCDMSLGNLSVSAFQFSGGAPISAVLGASLFYDVFLSLRKFEVAFAKQLYTKKGLIFDWKSFYHWKRLDPKGPVSHWFTLICDFLDQSSISDDLHIEGLWNIDVCNSGAVFGLSHCLSSANMRVVNVYTDGSLRDLSSREIKCDAAAYFSDLDMSIGAKIGELVSLTMAELQMIALALECVPFDSFVMVYSNSQVVLDACVAESALVSPDFCNCCNERADKLASLAVSSSLALLVLVRKRFIMAIREAMSENVCHFAYEIFRSINWAYWEVGPGFNIVDDSLLGDVNWFCTASMWHPDSYMAASFTRAYWEVGPGFNIVDDSLLGDVNWFCTASMWHPDSYMAASFTSKSMVSLHFYFLKALYYHLPVAVQKHLYSKVYLSVLCLYCGEVKSFDHFFVCTFDSDACKSILKSHLAKWQSVSGLGLHLSHVSQVLSLCISDNVLYTTMGKVQKTLSILGNTKVVRRFIVDFVRELGAAHYLDIWVIRAKYRALMEKSSLILFDGFVYSVTHSLSCMFSAGVIRLLGISKAVGVCFGFCKHSCFFSGINGVISVLIDL